jgi:hypothetical protein
LTITTAADGSFTGYLPTNGIIRGRIVCFKYTFGTLDATLDLTITGETSGVPVLAYTDVPATDAWWYPLANPVLNTTGAAIADAGVDIYAIGENNGERLKVVVAQGGNVQEGTLEVWTDEP